MCGRFPPHTERGNNSCDRWHYRFRIAAHEQPTDVLAPEPPGSIKFATCLRDHFNLVLVARRTEAHNWQTLRREAQREGESDSVDLGAAASPQTLFEETQRAAFRRFSSTTPAGFSSGRPDPLKNLTDRSSSTVARLTHAALPRPRTDGGAEDYECRVAATFQRDR